VSSFTAPLVLEALPFEYEGRGVFSVYIAFSYDIGWLGSGNTVTVPEGFRTDLCSVPALIRPFICIAGPMAKPALLHDYLLATGRVDLAAEVLDESLRVARVGWAKRTVVMTGCRFYVWTKTMCARLTGKPVIFSQI
jgi:hypothetical protein